VTQPDLARAEAMLASLPDRYRGPGGVAGIVHEGKIVARHVWGFSDLAQHVPMTRETLLPICSISKQFTCATLLDVVGDPARLDGRLAEYLPNLEDPRPTVANMCDNQSGLRDYWALTVLHGATPEAAFRRADAATMLARMRHTHFAPGTSYSYSNGNFRILSDLIEDAGNRPLEDLYRERIFTQAGMHTMRLTADTAWPAGGTVGYEGTMAVGFFPARNGIFWTGDAGLSGSLDDMLAWECFIDATRADEGGLYRRISAPPTFADGTPARYGFGLVHGTVADLPVTGHGGALRGFRIQRLHAANARLSVVVMFNHEASAYGAATAVMAAALGPDVPAPQPGIAGPGWNGTFFDAKSGLVLRVEPDSKGRVIADYAGGPEPLHPDGADRATSDSMNLQQVADGLNIHRPGEAYRATAHPLTGTAQDDIDGWYVCDELGATMQILRTGHGFYASASGFLGTGPMQPVFAAGPDVWLMPCQRSMDAPAPGDWTLHFERAPDGTIAGMVAGCWLARNVRYRRAERPLRA